MGVSSEDSKRILLNGRTRPWARGTLGRVFPFLRWAKHMSRHQLRADLLAGLTGAVIVLPQGVTFALIAGLPPEYGLYTAIVSPIVAGLFGSSWHMVSGPTMAISIVVLSIVSNFVAPGSPQYIPTVVSLTFLVGAFQFLLGLARMGSLSRFLSHTVVVGFTAGAAVLIGVGQLEHFLGLSLPHGESIFRDLRSLTAQLGDSNPYVVLIASATVIASLLIRRYRPRWPGMLIALVAGSLVCLVVDGGGHGVPLVGSLPGHLPPPTQPEFSLTLFRELTPGALAVAILGLIQAVSIARAVANRSQQRIDGNQEFIGQGLANMAGSFFSCYVSSGSFTRSAVNYEAGAKTPLSAVFASAFVALMLVFLAPLTAYLPLPAAAGVIILVAWDLIDIGQIRQIVRVSSNETTVLVVTGLATFLVPLEFAIYIGVLLSLATYLQRTSHPNVISLAPDPSKPKRLLNNVVRYRLPECPQLKILRLDGSLFFGAVDHVQLSLHRLTAKRKADWKHLLIIASGINFIDVAGAEMLVREALRLREKGGALYLCGVKGTARRVLERGGYLDRIGQENLFSSKEEAIRLIFQRLDSERCSICQRRVFRECVTVECKGKDMKNGEKPAQG